METKMVYCTCGGCVRKDVKLERMFVIGEIVKIPADLGFHKKASGKVECEFIEYTPDMERGIVKILDSGKYRELNLHWINHHQLDERKRIQNKSW